MVKRDVSRVWDSFIYDAQSLIFYFILIIDLTHLNNQTSFPSSCQVVQKT